MIIGAQYDLDCYHRSTVNDELAHFVTQVTSLFNASWPTVKLTTRRKKMMK